MAISIQITENQFVIEQCSAPELNHFNVVAMRYKPEYTPHTPAPSAMCKAPV